MNSAHFCWFFFPAHLLGNTPLNHGHCGEILGEMANKQNEKNKSVHRKKLQAAEENQQKTNTSSEWYNTESYRISLEIYFYFSYCFNFCGCVFFFLMLLCIFSENYMQFAVVIAVVGGGGDVFFIIISTLKHTHTHHAVLLTCNKTFRRNAYAWQPICKQNHAIQIDIERKKNQNYVVCEKKREYHECRATKCLTAQFSLPNSSSNHISPFVCSYVSFRFFFLVVAVVRFMHCPPKSANKNPHDSWLTGQYRGSNSPIQMWIDSVYG